MGEARRKSCIWWKPGPSHSLSSRLSADLHPIKRLPCFPHSPPPPCCPLLLLYACLRTETFSKTLKKKSTIITAATHCHSHLPPLSSVRAHSGMPLWCCRRRLFLPPALFLKSVSGSFSKPQPASFFLYFGRVSTAHKEIKVIKKNINKEARPARIQVGTGDEDGERPSLRH